MEYVNVPTTPSTIALKHEALAAHGMKPAERGRFMRFEKRIRALEARMVSDPVVLTFADGTMRQICGSGDHLLALFVDAIGGADRSPWQAELDLIRESVAAYEPSGGRMVEAVRCALYAQAEVQRSVAQDGC